MPAEKVRELDRLLDQASMLTTDQRAIIRFAEKATRSPAELSVQDVATFYEASGGEGCFIDAAIARITSLDDMLLNESHHDASRLSD